MIKKIIKGLFLFVCLLTITGCNMPGGTNNNNKTENEIKYVLDGGRFEGTYPKTYEFLKDVELVDPVKDGYTFLGWYLDKEFTGDAVEVLNESSKTTVTLYAKWEEVVEHVHEFIDGICSCGEYVTDESITYTIEYIVNGGTLPADAKHEYYLGENYELPSPRQAGKEFVGWYDYTTDEEVTQTTYGNLKVYAIYHTATIYSKIEYVLDGGTLENEVSEYLEGQTMALPAPKKDGYYFRGWYKDSLFTEKIVAVNKQTFGDLTLHAKWVEATMENTNIAIMGDSISTFYSPNSKVNSIWQGENQFYYPRYAPSVSSVTLTWWYQTVEALGANLLVNNSLSGSAVCVGNHKASDRARILKNMYNNQIPDVLIIYMGVNDGVSEVATNTFEKGYRTMLELIETNFPSCQVFVCTLPYETYTDGTYRIPYNDVIEKLADEFEIPVIDFENLWDASTEKKNDWHYLYDNIHPGTLGMQKIAQVVTKAIKDFYGVE